jgi:hypothetical protein
MKPLETSKYVCAVCGKKTNMCCSLCNSVFYCTVDHQRQHWAQHKATCPKAPPSQPTKPPFENQQLVTERAMLRKLVISHFATGEYEPSIIPCKKLIMKSR